VVEKSHRLDSEMGELGVDGSLLSSMVAGMIRARSLSIIESSPISFGLASGVWCAFSI
jgi:hypothetical protein